MRLLILVLIALLFVLPAAAQENPFPDMNPAKCADVAAYYQAEVNPWLGEVWADNPPDAKWFDRLDYDDQGGVWVFRLGNTEYIYHFSKYDAQPPNPDGGYPYTWGYHDVCAVKRTIHPLRLVLDEARGAFQAAYYRAFLWYAVNH